MMYRHFQFVILLLAANLAQPGFSWGMRGHSLIAVNASRLMEQRMEGNKSLSWPFNLRRYLVGYLSNTPDVIWKQAAPDIYKMNGPTHFIDLDYLTTDFKWETTPMTVADARAFVEKNCALPLETRKITKMCPPELPAGEDPLMIIGSSPWRINQLFVLMRDTFAKIKPNAKGEPLPPKELEALVNEVLLYAGIMSHFVGDLAQPYHATRDYNGWDIGQGGIHRYFEEDIVDVLPANLEAMVYDAAIKDQPFKKVMQQVPQKQREAARRDPIQIAFAVAFDSLTWLDDVNSLDKKYALTKPSSNEPVRVYAERRPPEATMQHFKAIIVQRMALGVDVLATIWTLAWEDGGKPDMSKFQSYTFPGAPSFIPVDYARPLAAAEKK